MKVRHMCDDPAAHADDVGDPIGIPAHGSGSDLSRRSVLALTAVLLVPACARQSRAAGIWYTCVEGDTLTQVGRKSGVDITVIAEANSLSTYKLAPGQRLWLPGGRIQIVAAPPVQKLPAPAPGPQPPDADDGETTSPKGYVLVPRSAWTDDPVAANSIPLGKASRISVHHTDEHAGMAGLPDTEVIRRIERYHRQDKGWAAIGYHFLVGKDGKAYEGRPLRYQGAHTSMENEGSIGISVIGNYMTHLPSKRQLAALNGLIDDLRKTHRIARDRVKGHREWRPGWTQCPGDSLLEWVKGYRAT